MMAKSVLNSMVTILNHVKYVHKTLVHVYVTF
jgi:hypothetical protein